MITFEANVICDHPGCSEQTGGEPRQTCEEARQAVMVAAEQRGWKIYWTTDDAYCPRHSQQEA